MPCLASLSVCFVQVATCASSIDIDIDTDIHGIDATIPANKGAEGAVGIRERAVNEAALCVLCACGSSGVCLCVVVCHVALPWLPPLSLPPFSVPVCAHGGFRVVQCHIRPRPRSRLKPAGYFKFLIAAPVWGHKEQKKKIRDLLELD